ncbi:hypothetical protein ACFY1J_00325 [Streptomyces sp. NPDC001406]|uniref:hypothetical protein n=1 Tax=Streptomyces sp. NPDC001406 TaxID=3364572 RepID=UPI003676EBC1
MGTDIHGLIECRAWAPGLDAGETSWHAAIDLTMLGMVTRDYEAFACLFGVRNYSGLWRPVVADRGLPPDASTTTRAELSSWGAAAFGTTWPTWTEISAIDWNEPATPGATRIARYHRAPDGTLHLTDPAVWPRAFARASGINTLTTDPSSIPDLCPEGTLAEVHGTENVRLVVWFDE